MAPSNAVTAKRTDRRRTVERALSDQGKPDLETIIRAARRHGLSWPLVADHQFEQSGEWVAVETIRSWFPDLKGHQVPRRPRTKRNTDTA